MSAPLTFLGGAIVTWVAVRAATAAFVPAPLAPMLVPPLATPMLDPGGLPMPSAPAYAGNYPPGYGLPPTPYPAYPAGYYAPPSDAPAPSVHQQLIRPTIVYVPYPADRGGAPAAYQRAYAPPPTWAPEPAEVEYDGREYASLAPNLRTRARGGALFGDAPGVPTSTPTMKPPRIGPDRWSVSSWALMRQPDPLAAVTVGTAPQSLASGGVLGGSQAGMRVTYHLSPALALNARFSAPVDQQKVAGEGAFGISWQPLLKVPVRLIAERRQRLGKGGGRSDFALLAEGGVYGQLMPMNFTLEGYAQAGVVGITARDMFADGGFAFTRPFLTRFALGAGAWGGIQPGLSRLDIGPRVSMRLFPKVKAHIDYRWQLLGNARPGSGPALTLAGDF